MSVSQLCRVDAELLLETSREVTRNGKAHLGRHLTDGLVGLLQERIGFCIRISLSTSAGVLPVSAFTLRYICTLLRLSSEPKSSMRRLASPICDLAAFLNRSKNIRSPGSSVCMSSTKSICLASSFFSAGEPAEGWICVPGADGR